MLVAGSDAPVDSRDPRPFENTAAGIVQAAGSGDEFRASQRTSLAEMLAATHHQRRQGGTSGDITGSIEAGKSADFIVLDRGSVRPDSGRHPELIADTQVEQTVFMGRPSIPDPDDTGSRRPVLAHLLLTGGSPLP